MEEAQPDRANNFLEMNINGKIYKVDSSVPPKTSLLDYIREYTPHKGTKRLCNEGGCGACTVVATFKDQETGKEKTCSVKSCQTLVRSCNRWVVETIERLGDRYRGYHSLEKALVGFYGTQCGFCSPGFIMTIYGALKSSGQLTKEQVEKLFDGNLCRCTGYRPILDAFKSMAIDAPAELAQKLVDIEDSYKSTCPKTGEFCKGTCSNNSVNNEECPSTAAFSTATRKQMASFELQLGNIMWHHPVSLKDLYKILEAASPTDVIQLVVGNTAQGVYKDDLELTKYIDVTGIQDLHHVAIGIPLVVGANVSLNRCIQVFREMANKYNGYGHLSTIADHWENVANVSVRNVGSWAGNLMLKHKHKEFPSDIFVTLIVADARITVGHAAGSSTSIVSVEELMDLDMSSSVIISMELPPQDENIMIRTYKISPRAVNAHAYVNCAFKFQVDDKDGFRILSKPTIVYGGINRKFVHASKTEELLTSRKLSVESVIMSAVEQLGKEIVPEVNPVESSPEYRISLTQNLFYKAVLNMLGDFVSPRFRSGATIIKRPISSGQQTFDPNQDTWPVGKAIPKIESNIQVSGEAEYVDDMDPLSDELFGAFVQSTVANATLSSVDPSEALKIPGVVSFVEAKDIPATNSFYPFGKTDPIFISGKVSYAGQPIGLIVATSKSAAKEAVKKVKVQYTDVTKPILTIREAQPSKPKPFKPIEGADHTVIGEFEQGSQFHFMLEPLTARVIPVEDGYDVYCTTQWPTNVQTAISNVLGINNNSVTVSVRRLGGGFGGKISRPNLVACAAAVAAHKLQKPVRIALDLTSHMTLVGWRDPYLTTYKVGFNNDGSLVRVEMELISNAGFNSNETSSSFIYGRVPNVYYAKTWFIGPKDVNTDTAANTPCRTPGTVNAIASMENVIERVAEFLHKDPAEIREKNFLDKTSGQSQRYSPKGENLVRTKIFPLLKEKADYANRRAQVQQFNKTHRWRKKGLSMVPLYYELGYPKSFRYNTQVFIYAADGTVIITHGGIEMGQGLNTKAAQVAAKVLEIPMSYIKVKPTNTITGVNSIVTGGSYGSDMVAHGIQKCCESLKVRMDVVKKKMAEKRKQEPTWEQLVQACLKYDVDLSEKFWTASNTHPESYDIFAAACMEVELDVLTGQFLMTRADIVEDCGRSLSPYVDIGQIEGAFIKGLGLYTSEEVKFDAETGQKLTNGTWTYKIPTALDIPVDLRITLLPKGDNEFGVQRSKATGEPAVCLGYSVVTAMRQAISSARADAADSSWFEITTPLTVEKVQQLCKVNPSDLVLKTQEARMMAGDDEEDFHVVNKADLPQIQEASCNLN